MKKSYFSSYYHLTDFLNKRDVLLIKRMNSITIFVTIFLVAVIIVGGGGNLIVIPPINAQENSISSLSQSQNATTATATTNTTTSVAEEKTYILIFGHRIVGNIDNSTKIVSSIVGNNSVKIQEEFLEEISLAPSQELEEQINMIVNDAINGSPCSGVSLTTEEGENVSVDCISSGNTIIWYIHPTQ
jgi:hypothetical protein